MQSLKKSFLRLPLIIVGVLLLFALPTKASHIVGSDISYSCSGTPGVYYVQFKLYRDCAGIELCANCPTSLSPACNIQLDISGAAAPVGSGMPTSPCTGTKFGTQSISVVASVGVYDAMQLCNLTKTICSNCGTRTAGTFMPGVEVYTFAGTVNLNAIPSSCCMVSIAWSSCCRSASLTTLLAPSGQNFYSEAIINRCATPCNSSPIFTNAPVLVACAGQDFYYNLGAIDPDGDSLSYAFGTALGGANSPLTYVSPYSTTVPFPYLGAPIQSPPALPPSGISIDASTGDIRFRPMGTFVAMLTIEVKQWRNIGGIPTLMGITRRDIQFSTLNCPSNNPPVIRTYDQSGLLTTPQPNFSYAVCAGQSLCFMIGAWDNAASTDTTDLSWNAPTAMVANGATFTKCYNAASRDSIGPKQDSAKFCWTPPSNVASNLPYNFTVIAKDRACPIQGSVSRTFSILVRKVPQAKINKIDKGCNTYDFSYTLQNNASIDQSYTKYLIETDSNIYITYNANSVSNHHFTKAGWHRLQLKLSTLTPPAPNGCEAPVIWDSIYITPAQGPIIFGTINGPKTGLTSNTSYGYSILPQTGVSYNWLTTDGTILSGQGTPSINASWNSLGSHPLKVILRNLVGCEDSLLLNVNVSNAGPEIIYFTPDSAATHDTVTIYGNNLLGASSVTLGGVNAQAFGIISANQIKAIVGTGASGSVQIITPLGTAQKAGFIYINSAGIKALSVLNGISVYPNPASNELVICCFEKEATSLSIVIKDLTGKIIAEPILVMNGNQGKIVTQNLAPGTYILCIQKGNEISRLKFVKE